MEAPGTGPTRGGNTMQPGGPDQPAAETQCNPGDRTNPRRKHNAPPETGPTRGGNTMHPRRPDQPAAENRMHPGADCRDWHTRTKAAYGVPVTVYQPSMFDVMAAESQVEPLPGRLTRHVLTAGAWVDVLPGWVHGSSPVFETLLTQVDWRAERRQMYDGVVDVPRLLRWYGGDEILPHPTLTAAKAQ